MHATEIESGPARPEEEAFLHSSPVEEESKESISIQLGPIYKILKVSFSELNEKIMILFLEKIMIFFLF